jgi:hypothetical protein
MSRASALVANFLKQKPGNVAHARLATLKVLLSQPEFQNRLLGELEQLLGKRNPGLLTHFRKIRPLLLEHAGKVLQPDTDRESLLDGLEEAVLISKEFAEAHPPRRRTLRASQKLTFSRGGIRG